jgi:hypothetical protein
MSQIQKKRLANLKFSKQRCDLTPDCDYIPSGNFPARALFKHHETAHGLTGQGNRSYMEKHCIFFLEFRSIFNELVKRLGTDEMVKAFCEDPVYNASLKEKFPMTWTFLFGVPAAPACALNVAVLNPVPEDNGDLWQIEVAQKVDNGVPELPIHVFETFPLSFRQVPVEKVRFLNQH